MTSGHRTLEDLLAARAEARAAKDWAESDRLRDAIADLGFVVRDTADGQVTSDKPPYDVLASAADLPDRSAEPDSAGAVATLLVDGWPDDVRTCVEAMLQHGPPDLRVVLCENGPTDAGAVIAELAAAHERVEQVHLDRVAGWSEARNALVRAETSAAHVVMDLSTVLEGDAITPLLAALSEPGVAAAGWRGVRVVDGWTDFEDAGTGDVEALLSYLLVVRRAAALEVPLPAKARFYRNADMEWSFLLREAGQGRLVAVDVPARQDRHHGYHDSDPTVRDRESKKTYDRFLQRFRGREELRLPR